MKTEIPLFSIVIAVAIYACSVWLVWVYLLRSLATSALQGRWLLEEMETLF